MNDNFISEEIFCLNYELNTLANLVLRTDAERWVKNFIYPHIENEHLNRYLFLIDKVHNKKVLDIACGSGYGSYILASNSSPKKVVGVDLNKDSIRYANHRYPHKSVSRIVEDAIEFSSDEKFDIIICFETIEHIQKYDKLLKNLSTLLSENGCLFLSTPIVETTTSQCYNPHHVIEWSINDFEILVKEHFKIVNKYVQNIKYKQLKINVYKKLYYKLKEFVFNVYNIKELKIHDPNIIHISNINSLENIESGYQLIECKNLNMQ